MIDESDMLRRYAEEKSEEAFAAFVRQSIDLVFSAALRRMGGNAHAAADVAQVVFITAARHARSLARHPCVTAWLHATTRNAAFNLMRDENLRQQREREAQAAHAMAAVPAEHGEWERVRPVLDGAMDGLSERDREAVLQRFFQQRSFVELGRRWQLSENGARMRVERAVEKLQTMLAKRGITSTAGALAAVLAQQAAATAPVGLASSVTAAALSSAAGGAVFSAATLVHFMTTTKFLGGATAILALLAVGTIGYLGRAQRQADSTLATAREHHAARVARLREVERRAHAGEKQVIDLRQAVAAAEASAATEAARVKAAAAWNPAVEGRAFMQRHPDVSRAYLEWSDSSALFRFDGLLKSLHLTPAQVDRFKFLCRSVNLGPVSRPITEDGRSATLSAEGTLAPNDAFREMRSLLGEDGYKEYREWNRTKFARDSAHMAAGLLCFTDSGLTQDQARQMTQIITAAMPRQDSMLIDWDAVGHTMKTVLTTDQWFAWENVSALGRANRANREATLARQRETALAREATHKSTPAK